MAGIEDPTEIAINIYPFIDLRNLINPFKEKLSEDLITTWANLQPGEFKSKEIAQQKLAVHFGKVCTDLQKVEREICSDKSSKFTPINGETRNHIRINWKWLKDCNDKDDMNAQGKVNNFKGYPMNKFSIDAYTFIKGSKRGSARQKVFSSNEKILSEMKKIQKQILTKGQAFKFLKNLKEVFHYTNLKNERPPRGSTNNTTYATKISTPKGKVLMELIKKQLETLEERSTQYKYIEDISNLTIHEARKKGYNVERMCKEKFTFLMNYCFSCMILNGIIKDYEDLEKGNINYVDGKKIYLTGFLGKSPDRPEGTKISYKEYIELVEEGIFINETVNHLSFYFKKKNNPDKKSDENEELRELLTRFDASSTLPRSTKKPKFKTQDPKSGWSEKIFFSLKTYLPTKFLFNPENEVNKNVLIKRVLNELDSLSAAGKPSKFIMMCLLRPEIDATYCTGARNTLTFAKSVCSTCT